jgi:hypothetical protein
MSSLLHQPVHMPLTDSDDDEESAPLIRSSSNGAGARERQRLAAAAKGHKVGLLHHAALSTYWFGWSFVWLPLLIVILPSQIVHIAGDSSKGSSLGTTLLLGSVASLFCAPLFGSMSDRCTHHRVSIVVLRAIRCNSQRV